MRQTYSYKEKVREFIIVLLPIFITQIALISTGFFDTIMAGNAGDYDLAGVAVAVNIFMPVFCGVLGVISGLTPIIAQLYGAGQRGKLPFIVVQGMYLSGVISAIFILVGCLTIEPLLRYMELEPQVESISLGFLKAIAWGICPILIGSTLRNFIDALGYTRVTMLITVGSVPMNILLNYFFIFGKCGFPVLGGIGAGVGSAITYWLVLFMNILVVYYLKPFKEYKIFSRVYPVAFKVWRQQLAIGIPIGSAIFCEQSIFGAVGLFMAVYGTEVIAAHQAALNFSTMVYMIPLSISMTLTILIGFEIGAKRYSDAKLYTNIGMLISLLFSGTLTLLLIMFKAEIAALYTHNALVHQLIQMFFLYVVFLQLADAINAPMQGALRGYKDVKVTLCLAIISYWSIGLPVGYGLANYGHTGPYGYWLGLITGVVVGAVLLFMRLRYVRQMNFQP